MHLAIVGSRHFHDYELLKNTVDEYVKSTHCDLLTIISGGSPGTDALAERYARETNTMFVVFSVNRSRYGRNATAIRDRLVVEKCTNVIAFSAADSVEIVTKARTAGKRCMVVNVKSSL